MEILEQNLSTQVFNIFLLFLRLLSFVLFLSSGCKKVIVTDNKKPNEELLADLQNKYKDKLLRLRRFPSAKVLEEYGLDKLEEETWFSEPKVGAILTILSTDKTKLLLNSYLLRKQFPFNFGRTPIFILTDDSEAKVLLMDKNGLETEKRIPSRSLTYMYLYERTFLAEIPKLKNSQKYTKLIKLQPRTDLSDIFTDDEKFKEAEIFLKHLFSKPYERVIPKIEKICPNLGAHLIDMNISMLQRVKDLDFRLVTSMFRLVSSNENYSKNLVRVLSARHEF